MAKISVGLDVVHVFHKIFEEMLAVFLPDDIVKFWPSYLRFASRMVISLTFHMHLLPYIFISSLYMTCTAGSLQTK